MPRASKSSRAAPSGSGKPAKKQASRSTAARKAPAKASAAKKPAAARKTAAKKAPAKAVKKAPVKKTSAKKAPVKKAPPFEKAPPAHTPVAKKAPAPVKKKAPARRPAVKDKFTLEQEVLLHTERATYVEQAEALKAEADQLAAEMEPGDIQFDDESGEGATATVDRERDLALSAQARVEIEEIDHALAKIEAGTYGTCENCGQPILKARLKAIPHARLCVACKSGGLSRR